MAVGDIYIKFKGYNKTRKEMCCLAVNLFNCIEEYRIRTELDELSIPKGYYLLQRI